MTKTGMLTIFCALGVAFATPVLAKTTRTKVVVAPGARQVAPGVDHCRSGLFCRQDLFDRNNPNNIRSDWPGPPAQPGQF
jgi:hypothetical protein